MTSEPRLRLGSLRIEAGEIEVKAGAIGEAVETATMRSSSRKA